MNIAYTNCKNCFLVKLHIFDILRALFLNGFFIFGRMKNRTDFLKVRPIHCAACRALFV